MKKVTVTTESATDTGISSNGYFYGKTLLVLYSNHWDSGDATRSELFMIRCGYDGNHIEVSEVAVSGQTGTSPTFSVGSNGNIFVNNVGIYKFISNQS